MIVAGLILAVPLGLAAAVFIDWGGPRRVIQRARLARTMRELGDLKGTTLVDDLAGRVRELV